MSQAYSESLNGTLEHDPEKLAPPTDRIILQQKPPSANRRDRGQRPAGRGEYVVWGDFDHAAMMAEPAGRLVAWPAVKLGRRLHGGGQRIERCPMP
jgi:hypothetical protein